MGVYDIYGDTQLKVGPCLLKCYNVGDEVEIPDGIYIANEGVVVILDGKFVAEFDKLMSKWGDVIDPGAVIDSFHPVKQALRELDIRMGRAMGEEEK